MVKSDFDFHQIFSKLIFIWAILRTKNVIDFANWDGGKSNLPIVNVFLCCFPLFKYLLFIYRYQNWCKCLISAFPTLDSQVYSTIVCCFVWACFHTICPWRSVSSEVLPYCLSVRSQLSPLAMSGQAMALPFANQGPSLGSAEQLQQRFLIMIPDSTGEDRGFVSLTATPAFTFCCLWRRIEWLVQARVCSFILSIHPWSRDRNQVKEGRKARIVTPG